jgi:signal transduction histidine kinase/ActR/RegA family two-component response regulator/predicted hydrocarbon binding protein
MSEPHKIDNLLARIKQLEEENAMLRRDFNSPVKGDTVTVPDAIKPLFDEAQKTVGEYFRNLKMYPTRGTIEINDQRYVLVRASALSNDFLNTIQQLYADRGEKEAMSIGKNFLFDIAHVIGMNDGKNFHQKMDLTDPIAKMAAGPVHFAYSGWAYVDILPESSPSPDDNFYLIYNHPFSFEADSWIRSEKKSDVPVCVMNSGYSSGWCEESFGIPLTSVEVTCKAKGDEHCTFIMSPPHKIQEHVERFAAGTKLSLNKKIVYDIPTFFERKNVEEEMRNARKKAEESDKAKSEFLANMSHEIRTPMNAIIGYVDLMLQDNVSLEHRSYLETLKDSGKLLLTLISDILDLSKIEAGQLVVDTVPYSLHDLMDSVEFSINGIVLKSGNKIIMKKNTDAISEKIFIDPTRLQQILFNLLSNAVKFTNDGVIEFGFKLKDSVTLEFYVKDSGIGINEKDHSKIFEMFGQADASYTREHGGSGLGLTISKKLVELMDGKIWVESLKGKGSTFYFTLPYKPATEENENNDILIDKSKEIVKDCLLLVEDNMINQRLTKLILEKAGYRVLTANNGQEAVDIYQSGNKIKLIIMDIQMPVLDGLSATQIIRYHEVDNKLNRTPIIALTAHAMKGDKGKCIDAGCDNYLSKPIMIDVLINTIKKYI